MRMAGARHKEPLAAGIAVGTLGDRYDRKILDAEFGEDLLRCCQLSLSAVDQDEIRPLIAGALRIFLQSAPEAAAEYLAHHCVIVAASCGFRDIGAVRVRRHAEAGATARSANRELAVGILYQTVGPATIIAPTACAPWMWLLS